MFEDSYSKKQVIKIVAITWILSFVTTLVVVNFFPPIPKNSWHKLEIYEGTFQGSKEDPDNFTYEITPSADIWRVSWRLYCPENTRIEDVYFQVIVSPDTFSSTDPSNYVTEEDFRSYTGEWLRHIEGSEYFFGSGRKWLIIRGIQINWVVVVEEYY